MNTSKPVKSVKFLLLTFISVTAAISDALKYPSPSVSKFDVTKDLNVLSGNKDDVISVPAVSVELSTFDVKAFTQTFLGVDSVDPSFQLL